MSVENILWLACTAAAVALICVLVYRRLWRTFPVFFLYIVWTFIADAGGYGVLRYHRSAYAAWYLAATIVESILLLGVLVELAWSILRPIRAALSRRALIPVIGLILVVGAIVWPFAAISGLSGASGQQNLIVQLQQAVAALQIIFFFVLVAGGQMLSIGWRDREFQLATGLGIFSFVEIAAAFLHMHETSWLQYRHLFRIETGVYFCTLLYWTVSFARQEAARREFTPQMRSFLLTVAGAAHANRIALAESSAVNPPEYDRRSP